MKKLILGAAWISVLAFLCAGPLLLAESKPKPKIEMKAHPRQGFTPMLVRFHAILEGVKDDDPEYYCLAEEWDFGDDSTSTEKPNCAPYTPGTRVKSEFFAEHEYDEGGNYAVRLILGDKKLSSKKISISVTHKTFP